MNARSFPNGLRLVNTTNRLAGLLSTVCVFGIALPSVGAVSDEEFNALKDMVIKQGQRIDQLERAHHQDQQSLQQDQKVHEQDQQAIQQLKQRIEEKPKLSGETQPQPGVVSQVQPVHPIPERPGATHNFMVVGDAEIQFGKTDGSHSAFALADFAPIFLFRARDNILFEAGFDMSLQNGSGGSHDSGSTASIGISFAQLDYMLNDYVTFVGGDMLLPLGTYSERSAGWLNKIPDDPLPRDLLPGSGIGVQLRGAVPVGSAGQSLTYSVYTANGPSSSDGSAAHDQLDLEGNVGIRSDGNSANLHATPSAGGRVGWFYPWKAHYDLELGISGQSGTWDDADHRLWSAAIADAALHLGPYFEAKGEYVRTWQETEDRGTLQPHGWWMQASYKLAGLKLDSRFLNNLELVGRYDTSHDNLGTRLDRYTVGYVYYLTNTLLFEGDYEFLNSNDPQEDHNRFVLQLSFGF